MADIHTYCYPSKGSTRRTASSHIPIPVSRLKEQEMNRRNLSAPEPSRLLLMQNRYQKQLFHEKEAKLIKMYKENQDAALGRVGGGSSTKRGGIVRDFFRERREIEQSNSMPSLDRTEHFQLKKLQNKGELVMREEDKERQLHHMRRAESERQLSQQQHHHHAGFSRSKPLAPIRKGQSESMKNMHQPPSSDGLYETTDRLGYNNHDDESSRKHFQPRQPLGSQTETKCRRIPQKTNKAAKSDIKLKWEYSDVKDEEPVPTKKTSPRKQVSKPKTKPQAKLEWIPPAEITDSDGEGDVTAYNLPKQRKPQVQPKQRKGNTSKTKPELEWKPPASYSSDEDDADPTPNPNFPKVTQIKRKPDRYSHEKKQGGNTQKASQFQKWQLEQDLERANRLESYQKELERKRQPEVDYQFDHNMKEQKAKQRQRKREFNKMEQQQMYMKELEEKIARKQLELAQMGHESEVDNTPRQPQSNPRNGNARPPQQNTERYSKQESFSQKQMESGFSCDSTPRDDRSSTASSDRIITKPVRVQSRGKSKQTKPNQRQGKQDPAPSLTPEGHDAIPQPSTTNYYAEVAEIPDAAGGDLDLRGCPVCGRRFAADRLARHAKVCQKAAKMKPRKVFDMKKQRIEGTELEAYKDKGPHQKDERPKKKSNWREKHNELVSAVQNARKVQSHIAKGGDIRDLPPPAPTQNSDYRQCPHCQRRFNPNVAERHIPKCREIKSRPPLPKKTGRR